MCRNITTLRGLEPPATEEEVEAAARQYLRKITGITKVSSVNEAAFDDAVRRVAAISAALIEELPARRVPPTTTPPLRRINATP